MATYVTGESLPNGTITTTIVEQVWENGKPRLKRCYTTVSGDVAKRRENKKVKEEKKLTKAKEQMQSKLDSFSQVDIKEEGF